MVCDNPFMTRALDCARMSDASVQPNPYVGAVIVKNGTILAEGRHECFGEPHAEVNALLQCSDPKGADMYVTLEPCSHFGKTPPCTDAIINAGISRVFVAMEDPNPLVGGAGIRKLMRAGIEVIVGMGENEARALNKIFVKNIATKKPYIIVKYAMSADGYIAGKNGDSKWLSNEESRKLVHTVRHNVQAVLVGSGTIVADDPLLTARLHEDGFQPRPIILDIRGDLPHPHFQALRKDAIIVTANEKLLAQTDAKVYTIPKKERLADVLFDVFARESVSSILVEGGSRTIGFFIGEQMFDEVMVFICPLFLLGGTTASQRGDGVKVSDAQRLCRTEVQTIGDTILLKGYRENVYGLG